MLESSISAMITGGVQLITGVRARWLGCGPADAPRIYFANHTSHLDFVLLWSALPAQLRRRTRPVAAGDYWKEGALRRYFSGQVFRSVLVDRVCSCRSAAPTVAMLEVLDRGESLILFPEGTRGTGEDLMPFKGGIFHIARERPDLELVPAWMDNSYRVMPKGTILPMPLLCTVTFGSPTTIRAGEEKAACLDRLRRQLLDLRTQ